MPVNPLLLLAIGVLVVVGMILVLRLNAFIALITAALLVSLLSPGEPSEMVSRVAEAFGVVVGKIGIVIALAAVIGKCLMDSGAADRIVRSFLGVLGEKRASWALMGSGYLLSIPVFFDTVFYLLIPLARSLCRRTGKNYVLYITAMVAGGAVTHSLVPPTPGPLAMASSLDVDLGRMILVGCLVGFPSSIVGLLFCGVINRYVDIPMRPYSGEVEPEVREDRDLPPLWLSLLPVLLPVVLIGAHTVTKSIVGKELSGNVSWQPAADLFSILGNPNMALFISAVIALFLLVWQRRISLKALGQTVETALMSGGIIILITAAGGAFGAMLGEAGIQDAVEEFVGREGKLSGVLILLLEVEEAFHRINRRSRAVANRISAHSCF